MAEYNLGRVAFVDKGAYSAEETYSKWDFVTTVDSTYLFVSTTPQIGKPITDTTFWKCIADGKPATLAAAAADLAKEAANNAATLANDKAGLAQSAATLANTKAGLANDAAILATEKAALADSKSTLANDKAILAQSAADNANAKAAAVTSAVLSAGSLGSIKPTDAAPTPGRNGNYTFSIGGNKPAWLTAESGITTVKAGDGVAVVYDGVSAYTYTHVKIDRIADIYNVTVENPLADGQYYTPTTARAAVPSINRKKGGEITYEISTGVWVNEKFIGSDVSNWATAANWEDKLTFKAQNFTLIADFAINYIESDGILQAIGNIWLLKSTGGRNLLSGLPLNFTAFTQALLYVDIKSGSSDGVNIAISNRDSMPVIANGYDRYIIGSVLKIGSNWRLCIPALGYASQSPYQTSTQVNSLAVVALNSNLVLSAFNGTTLPTWNNTTGVLSFSVATPAFIEGNKRIWISNSIGTYKISNFVVCGNANSALNVIYADFSKNPTDGTEIIINKAQYGTLPAIPANTIRWIIGTSQFTGGKYYFNIPLLGLNSLQLDKNVTLLQTIDTNKIGNWNNHFPNILKKCPLTRSKLASMADINMLFVGDSLFALQTSTSANLGIANLPQSCQNQNAFYHIWNKVVKNKPQYDRWDSSINQITETGSFTDAIEPWNSTEGVITQWGAEYRGEGSRTRYSDATNASINFSWDLANYEKLNFLYRSDFLGCTLINVAVNANNLVEIFTGSTWVELNGYSFSQYFAKPIEGSQNAVTLNLQKLELRRKSGAVGTATITLSKGIADSSYLMYWGTERWNRNSTHIINIARGGRTIKELKNNYATDIFARNPDMVVFELPLINEMSQFYANTQQIIDHVQDLIWGDRAGFETNDCLKYRSSNWTTVEFLFVIPHFRNQYFDENGFALTSNVGTPDQTAFEVWNKVKSLFINHGDVAFVDMGALLLREADFYGITYKNAFGGIGSASDMISNTQFMYDGVHPNNLGAKFWGKYLSSIFDNESYY